MIGECRRAGGVGDSIRKADSMKLLSGFPLYVDDLPEPYGCLTVRLLRSPHANALVKDINVETARTIPGVVAVFTYRDVPSERFTTAGQSVPETSAHDRLILDRHVRHVGDPVAIIAAETPEAAGKAAKAIRVEYEVLPAILDFHTAKGNATLVHPEEDWHIPDDLVQADPKQNLICRDCEEQGDVESVLDSCDVVIDHVYHVKAANQVPMETFRTMAEINDDGRLHVVASSQIVYHVRRILSHAIGIPESQICVEKPRMGGGFGAKQSAVSEIYPAFVTWKTGRPSKIVYTRKEALEAGSPRHEMDVHVRLGASNDGTIRAIDLYALSNGGAYSEHSWAVTGVCGHKSIPLYTPFLEAYRFSFDAVYTNVQASGAYRGFGATQGQFALESAVNELASRLHLDPLEIRMKNSVREGMKMPAYYGEESKSCNLQGCLQLCAERFGWWEKYPVRTMPDGKLRTAGMAMSMQGSSIAGIDIGSATVRLEENGTYLIRTAVADMGTGCDTVLAQILAERMGCSFDSVRVESGNTDKSPFDSGSYASSTTFLTGAAVKFAGEVLQKKMLEIASGLLHTDEENLFFENNKVMSRTGNGTISPKEIAKAAAEAGKGPLETTQSSTCPDSPPPFMVGMAEIEFDPETGAVRLLNYQAVVDCGTMINPALARVQAEGALVQGIGMTLTEDIHYSINGKLRENDLLKYRIPTRLDTGHISVDFAPSYEIAGPYGAKSIGEIGINTPAPAIAHAVFRASGKWIRELPITAEKILLGPD